VESQFTVRPSCLPQARDKLCVTKHYGRGEDNISTHPRSESELLPLRPHPVTVSVRLLFVNRAYRDIKLLINRVYVK
jgi:hypothetical protein